MPLTKAPIEKQLVGKQSKFTITVPLTLRGIDSAYEQLEFAKVRVKTAAQADLRRLFKDVHSRTSFDSEAQLEADIEEAREEIWRTKHAKRR